MSELLGRLGLGRAERGVVVCLDELGFSLAANEAVYGSLRHGSGTSASLLVPAPWARAAAAVYRGEDVGVQLTLNAELDLYRWGPVTQAPSLLDGDGGFPRTLDDVWDHADLDEVRREWRAQIERAILWGFDVSHLTSHLPAVALKPEFFDVYLDLADELRLPVRLPGSEAEAAVGFPFRALAEERGVVAPERVLHLGAPGTRDEHQLTELLAALPEGLSEIRLRPALDGAELRAAAPDDWAERVNAARLSARGGILSQVLARLGVARVGYRELRALMR
ncbi:MAG: hypothetical protein JWM85_1841 [Acidimicrobiaceae bacterium]|nr:hypothetical protein [Acidimicrobiaceae bacterium]